MLRHFLICLLIIGFFPIFTLPKGLIPRDVVVEPEAAVKLQKDVAQTEAAVVHNGRLLCVYSDGKEAAWDLKTGEFLKDVADELVRRRFTRIAAAGDDLWATDQDAIFKWSEKSKAWEKMAVFEKRGEFLDLLIMVGRSPILVFKSFVSDPIGKKIYRIPKMAHPKAGPPLPILATHGTDTHLWIGTGYGEWGGDLIGLDVKKGKWVHEHPGNYVTGITHSKDDEIIVSWSMDHFGASTQIVIHGLDGKSKTEFDELQRKYYQKITYNPYDQLLYGIESKDLVTIDKGKPTKVLELKGRLYEVEPNAIGVAPGVLALLPFDKKSVIVVPNEGDPLVVRDGKMTSLKKPKQ